MNILREFLQEMFFSKPIIAIRALRENVPFTANKNNDYVEKHKRNRGKSHESKTKSLKSNIIKGITWIMGIAFVLSLFAIIIYPILGITAPQSISELLFVSMGYFGGAFAKFMNSDVQRG